MRRLIQYVLILLLGLPVAYADEQQEISLTYRYDVDSATVTYCRLIGTGGGFAGMAGGIQVTARIKTTGSSTSVTAQTAGQNPFANVAVGDVLIVNKPDLNTVDLAVVTVRTDADNVTVDAAVDWQNGTSGRTFAYYDLQCGTTDNDGWIAVDGWGAKTITVQYDQGDLDALKVRYEARGNAIGALPVTIYPTTGASCAPGTLVSGFCELATAGQTTGRQVLSFMEPYGAARVGLAFKSTDASDAGANLERVTVFVTLQRNR